MVTQLTISSRLYAACRGTQIFHMGLVRVWNDGGKQDVMNDDADDDFQL